MMKIPPFKYSFNAKEIDYITSTIRSLLESGDFLTMGRYGEMFENEFKRYNGSPLALVTNCGTSALEIVLSCLNLKGKDVLIPANTFTATVIPVLNVGAVPVFTDCADDMCICPEDFKAKVTKNTGAVIPVHIGGYISPNMEEISDFCKERKIHLVEDAAHAVGSTLNGKKAGNFGIAAAFSFFSTKVMNTGEGGMIVTASRELFNSAYPKRNHGQVIDNHVDIRGNNWRMHEFQAITGLSQLERIDEIIDKRRKVADIYDRAFSGVNGLTPLQRDLTVRGNLYKYILKIDSPLSQEKIQKDLKERFDISLGGYVYPVPCHKQKVFKEYYRGSLPNTERLCKTHICPPIYPDMTRKEAEYVVSSLLEVLRAK